MRRLVLLAALAVVGSSCALIGGPGEHTYTAVFERAIQLFPGGRVRVLGVDVGTIADVRNVRGGVEVVFRVSEETPLPANVEAAIVPVSLLGERYVQLFPAHLGGPTLPPGSTIPRSRTAVPAEPDELLRSLQDYLGALDPENVNAFVENAAAVLDGTGEELNELIQKGASVIDTLAGKRNDLARIITSFERVARVAADRKGKVDRLINTYNDVVGTLTRNRTALEGTVVGLKDMSTELAALLLAHRAPLHEDIRALTRTGRTLSRNAERLARTGHWAKRLFRAASRAVDFDKDWLRLTNQGEHLEQTVVDRLQERLVGLCGDLSPDPGDPLDCASPAFWETAAPSLFCMDGECPAEPEDGSQPAEELAEAIGDVPELADVFTEQAVRARCAETEDPDECVREHRIIARCLDAARPDRCLRRHDLPVRCLEAKRPAVCLRRAQERELREAIDIFVDEALRIGRLR